MSAQKKTVPPMQAFTYLVKVIAGSSESTRVWNSKHPMIVGHPMRWELSQTAEGVKVTAHWTKTEHFVTESDIARGKGAIKLVCNAAERGTKGADGVLRLEIRAVAKPAAAFRQVASTGNSLKIFQCIGDWAVESVAFAGSYAGKCADKKVFSMKGTGESAAAGVYLADATIEIHAFTAGVAIRGADGKDVATLAAGAKRSFRFAELSGMEIRCGGSEWRLASFAMDHDPAFVTAPFAADAEAGLFKRTLMGAMAASLLFALIAFLMPSPPPVAKLETVHILLAKKKKTVHGLMTAAPTGDPHARDFSVGQRGHAKNAGKKGALAQSKKISPAGKPVKAAARPAKRAAKAIARSAPKAAAPRMARTTAKPASSRASSPVAKAGLKKAATVAARPAPVPHSALFKAFSSASFRRTAQGLAAGGASASVGSASSADARRLGSAGGTGRGALGGTGGVETRSASISGFGGGGGGDGDGGPGSRGAGYGRGSNSKASGQGRSFVSMDTGASEVDDGLTRDQVGRVINSHMNEIRYCYESATLRNNDVAGRLTTKFAINGSGVVQAAGVGASTVSDRRLHDCIVGRLKNWKFPKPKGGVTVAVAYPFDFKTLTR